jgi:ABC-2 type transport system ATP-binding protein
MVGKRRRAVPLIGPQTSSGLVVHDLVVKFGSLRALDGVDLRIEFDGGIVGLFGPNGAGKTTLMLVLAGLIQQHSGTVHLDGHRREVVFLPDRPYLYDFLSIGECVRLFKRRDEHFDYARARDGLGTLKLASAQKVGSLSRGRNEQVHLLLTLCRSGSLFLLDEPLAAVDPLTREFMIDQIRDRKKKGNAIVISTHLIADVGQIFDTAVVINDGSIRFAGSVQDLGGGDGDDFEERVKAVLRE